mmetsp:Transcript_15095/g.34802  ORF Transcript_15095/g.34802 Transcript_15095/m.34802 type:complete len:579 (-) Transcript_15095:244-1980(-)
MPRQLQHDELRHTNYQAENDDSLFTTSVNMMSPASMTSELKGAFQVETGVGRKHEQSSLQLDRIFTEELKDVLTRLTAQEASYERRRIRKQQHRNNRDLPPFHDSWRPVMVSWMYHVADTFRLMPIVVATGVYILDTCAWDLWNNSGTKNSREVYPLMTMTALNMAVKCHETKMFPLDQLVQLLGPNGSSSRGKRYIPEQVCSMERKILKTCEWKLHKPTAHDFLLRFAEVLNSDQRDAVMCSAVLHLKRSLLWEHVAHQQRTITRPFSDCTLAYAAFLLAMEDTDLPLVHKQAACMALLQVSQLSAQTPMLSEAYNWLIQARLLQKELEKGKTNPKQGGASPALTNHPIVAVPAHAAAPKAENQHHNHHPKLDVLRDNTDALRFETSTSTCATRGGSDDADLLLLPFDGDKKEQFSSAAAQYDPFASDASVSIIEEDSDDDESDDERSKSLMSQCSTCTHDEVIYCSYSSDGDAFEVIATDHSLEVEEDDQSMTGHDTNVSILPTVMEEDKTSNETCNLVEEVNRDNNRVSDEEEVANLVLSESLDEDGFEVAIQGEKSNDHLSSLMTSPREVAAAL